MLRCLLRPFEVGVLEVRMFSPVSSSALAITNVGYGADELNDSCADEKCLNAIAETGRRANRPGGRLPASTSI